MLDWRKWPARDIPSISKSLQSLIASCRSFLPKWASKLRAPPAVQHEPECTACCDASLLRQPGLPEPLIVSLHESAVFRVVRRRALLDRADRRAGRANLLADSQGCACFVLPTEECEGGCLQCE